MENENGNTFDFLSLAPECCSDESEEEGGSQVTF